MSLRERATSRLRQIASRICSIACATSCRTYASCTAAEHGNRSPEHIFERRRQDFSDRSAVNRAGRPRISCGWISKTVR